MEELTRYSTFSSMLVQYSDGRVSFLPRLQQFSVNLSTGSVSSGIPRNAYDLLYKNISPEPVNVPDYRNCLEEVSDSLHSRQQGSRHSFHVSIILKMKDCRFMFSNGISSCYSHRAGRIAVSESGRIVYKDFGIPDDLQQLRSTLLEAYDELVVRLAEDSADPVATADGPSADLYLLTPQAAAFFIHEVIGHTLEQDNWNNKKFELPPDRPFLPSFCSLVDDPAGSPFFRYGDYDDAGNRIRRTEAVVSGQYHSGITLLRCSDYTHLPIPRMSCFSLLDNPAGRSFEDMCSAYDSYTVIEEIANGGVNPFTGDFFISASRQRYTDKNHNRRRLPPATYCGKVPDLCGRILEIGNDSSPFLGTCSKGNQHLYVCSAAPGMAITGFHTL